MKDFYAFFDFCLLAGRFSIGCGSEFRAEVAYLEVGRLDLEPIHEKNNFHQISDIFMKSRIYSLVKFKKSNHKNALEAHFCDLISGEKPNSWLFDENVKKTNHAPRRAHDLISGEKPNSCPPPNPGWATAAAATAAEEFSQSIQAPSSTHPGISYPVRANPSLR